MESLYVQSAALTDQYSRIRDGARTSRRYVAAHTTPKLPSRQGGFREGIRKGVRTNVFGEGVVKVCSK